MQKKWRKLIAPIVITVFFLIYLIGFIVACLLFDMSWLVRIAGCVIPLALIGVFLFVLIERIQEIRSGEEDDLDNY